MLQVSQDGQEQHSVEGKWPSLFPPGSQFLLYGALCPTLLLCLTGVPVGEARRGRDEGHRREAGGESHRGRKGMMGASCHCLHPMQICSPEGVGKAELSHLTGLCHSRKIPGPEWDGRKSK